ncbi:MAG TPA: peptide chain release factor 1 [Saprospiraceae bacterium]|nr:peptide chain release factor 1 [Saprospiraceae bacterium]
MMIDRLRAIKNKYQDLELRLSDPEVIGDIRLFSKLHKEYKDLTELVSVIDEYELILANISSSTEMLRESDTEMREMAQVELEHLKARKEEVEEKLKWLLIPRDPEDTKDVIMEIRAGTGGDEASIFAGDLFRMYTRYFESRGWKYEIDDANEGTVGGYSKIVLEIYGEDVYGHLKYESGAHRVQRVPKTEAQGRVHTSAATVAILPKFELEEINIRKEDLKVDTFRSSGAGGQHVNKTESGVRFTHLPTGIVAESTDGRSQIKNREIALNRLYDKVRLAQKEAATSAYASQRKSLVGTGDRSDKIRTYNYPQNRVTDHRINLTLYNLDRIVLGDLDPIIDALKLAENTERLKEMVSEEQ